MLLDVSAQNLKVGDVVRAEMFSLRVARRWETQTLAGVRIIHVVWEHLDIDIRMTHQYLPSQRFEIERVASG